MTMREFCFREAVISDPRYGIYPGSRSIDEHIKRGIVVLDKPKGPTSHQVTGWLKDILDLDKAGHSGTLDPKVTGVLVVALEKSTKVMPLLSGLDKEYVAVMVLHEEVDEDRLEDVLDGFRGEITQIPPKKSAVKREERKREVKGLSILENHGKKVLLKIRCEAGTYIRKLVHDIGEELGCGAHMKELRRTAVGPFTEEGALKLQTVTDDLVFYLEEENDDIMGDILPVETVAELSRCIVVKDTAVEALCSGADLGVGGVSAAEENINEGEMVSLLSGKGELVAVAESMMDTDSICDSNKGKAASLANVIMERGTYPKAWK